MGHKKGWYMEFAGGLGLDPNIPINNNWSLESTSAYDSIIGVMEYDGDFARCDTGECPRSSHPTIWGEIKAEPANKRPLVIFIRHMGMKVDNS